MATKKNSKDNDIKMEYPSDFPDYLNDFLLWKQYKGVDRMNTSPDFMKMLIGETPPETSAGQSIPWGSIWQQHPFLSPQQAITMSGTYVYPEAYQEQIPMSYILPHEESHNMDDLSKLMPTFQNRDYSGIGNQGFFPSPNGTENHYTRAGMENWLLNYPPEERDWERKAHLSGMFNNLMQQGVNPEMLVSIINALYRNNTK